MSTDLRSIRTFKELTRYLEDELDWPLGEYDFEDLTFSYEPAELGLKAEDAVKVKTIRQLRPFRTNQPWGIFFVEFEKKNLPIVVLRRILRHLVLKKRASANAADAKRWQSRDLLFISAWGDEERREMTFAHFVDHPEMGLAELRVLGWDDDDTPLHMNQVATRLGEKLRWDEDLAADPEAWRGRWSEAFVLRHRHVITKSEELAAALAELAKRLRNRLRTILRMEDGFGEIRKLQRAFREGLIHDLTDDGFADMFAQTVTYGLFSVSVRRTFPGEGTAVIKDDVPNLIFTSPFLKEMLGIFLGIKSRKGAIDFDELGVSDVTDLLTSPDTHMEVVLADFNNKTRGEDPVIHFYERFLAAYNKQLKIQRGVFYTPQPVVSYIVRSVHELLQSEFHLPHGLADTATWAEFIQKSKINNLSRQSAAATDPQSEIKLPTTFNDKNIEVPIAEDEPFVQILDPATGTATFLVETIDVIHKHLKECWKKGGAAAMPSIPLPENGKLNAENFAAWWNCYVPHALLPRLHGYELMMAPYAIAHMKIGLKLAETGYRFETEERARIYLTNALEPWGKQLKLIGFDALAHEAAAVNEIKRHKRFTVVIGNPPYSPSICEPEWLMRRLDDWKQGLNETKSDLNREEWKFLRLAQHHCTITGTGIVGFIINRDFLDGIVKRRMREHLGQSFPLRIAVDLNGDVKGNIADENVFEIEQGVTVAILCTESAKQVLRFASRVGTRAQKYADLLANSTIEAALTEFEPSAPYFRWQPSASTTAVGAGDEYSQWMPLDTVFTLKSSGIQTKNDPICIAWSTNEMYERAARMAQLSAKEARAEFEIEKEGAWTLANAQADLRQFGISRKNVRRILYRPLDFRFTYYTHKSSGFLGRPRYDLMRHMVDGRNMGLIFNRQIVGDGVSHFSVSRDLTCHGTFYLGNKGQDYLAPLYLHDDDLLLKNSGRGTPNFTPAFTAALRSKLACTAAKLSPEDIFHYIYAVFHSPGYRSRYAEFLKIDFPRLPLAGNLELFRALSRLGGELTALHLLEAPKLEKPITEFTGHRNSEVEKLSWSSNTVWIDKKQTIGFRGVPEEVWNFHIGGYQVCEKWLKDRKGRTLSNEDVAHYHKIVIALSETIRLMQEIDAVIETHGGWPGAFQTTTGGEADPPPEKPAAKQAPAKPAKSQSAPDDAWIPGELFGVEGELKPAKKAKAAPEAAIPQPPRKDSSPRGDVNDKNQVIATFREVLAKQGACNRETLVYQTAYALGYQRVREGLAEKLGNAIRTAKRRGIVYDDQGLLHLDARTLDQWDRAHLKTQFLAAISQNGRVWIEREEAIRLFARWLGYGRTGYLMIETARSLINGLLRDGSIEKDGQDWIRRV